MFILAYGSRGITGAWWVGQEAKSPYFKTACMKQRGEATGRQGGRREGEVETEREKETQRDRQREGNGD